jgi:hypothetical protein
VLITDHNVGKRWAFGPAYIINEAGARWRAGPLPRTTQGYLGDTRLWASHQVARQLKAACLAATPTSSCAVHRLPIVIAALNAKSTDVPENPCGREDE